MIKLPSIILAILLALSTPVQRAPLGQEAMGTSQYSVHYTRGALRTKMATATLNLSEGTWEDAPAREARFSVRAAHVFRLFMKDEYRATLYMRPKDMSSLYYCYPYVKKGKNVLQEIRYRPENIEICTSTEGDPAPSVVTLQQDGVTLEAASIMFLLRSLDPASVQDPLPIGVIVAGRRTPAFLSYSGLDPDYWPGWPAYHYVLNMTERGLLENGSGNIFHIWISQDPAHELLGLAVPLGKATMTARLIP